MQPDITAAPEWFKTAVTTPVASHFVEIEGCAIHYLAWNDHESHKPPLVFAHGYRAHARWWSAIAPFFTAQFRVYALDFSGMGDSGTRPHYDADIHARDLAGFIEHLQLSAVTVVGHSFGGTRTVRVCAQHPGLIEHAIIVDSYLGFPDTDQPHSWRPLSGGRVFADYQTLRKRYRLLPEQPTAFPAMLDYVAFHSIRQVATGWRWKFDPILPSSANENDGPDLLARVSNRVDIVVAELSVVLSVERAQRIARSVSQVRGPIIVPQAHHHIMLDQPLQLISVLRALLATS
jgi:pimeloyl-ACP methyl ester carboxylesterase